MLSAIIFSRDRAAQLDLLLRSIKKNFAPKFFYHIDVLWTASDKDFKQGYKKCKIEHKGFAQFWEERNFQYQVTDLVCRGSRSICFFCDDDIVYRPFTQKNPDYFLLKHADVISVSLRLGLHTNTCYPLRRIQQWPAFVDREGVNVWAWGDADGDFGYPGSLDGHVFRRDQLHTLVDGDFHNPNTLEEVIVRNCRGRQPLLACYDKSTVVGNPVNRVNETHISNRFGESFYLSPEDINDAYLNGGRLKPHILSSKINAAHHEIELKIP